MTAPRPILPGRTYLVTRRCSQRQFLLRPDGETERIFLYCLAESAARCGVEIIAWTAMSDHYHAVVHDPRARLPAFLARFHRLVAVVLNARWKRRENLWSSDPTSVVHLAQDADILDKVLYVLVNPLNDDLVDRLANWPGASSLRLLTQGEVVVTRPAWFFRRKSKMPERVVLRATVPPQWRARATRWRARVLGAIQRREEAHRQALARRARQPVDRQTLTSVSPFRRARSREPRVGVRPVLACSDRQVRRRLAVEHRAFVRAHACARARWVEGDRAALFPEGTYLLRFLVRPPPLPGRETSSQRASK